MITLNITLGPADGNEQSCLIWGQQVLDANQRVHATAFGTVTGTSPRGMEKEGTCLSAATTCGQGVCDAVRVDVALVIPLLCGRSAQGRGGLGRLRGTRRAGRVVEVLGRSRNHGTEPLPEDVCGIHLRGLRLLRGRKGINWVRRGAICGSQAGKVNQPGLLQAEAVSKARRRTVEGVALKA